MTFCAVYAFVDPHMQPLYIHSYVAYMDVCSCLYIYIRLKLRRHMCACLEPQTKATFLKLAGPQLVQMFIGDGAKMVRDAFELAKEKAPAIIFIGMFS